MKKIKEYRRFIAMFVCVCVAALSTNDPSQIARSAKTGPTANSAKVTYTVSQRTSATEKAFFTGKPITIGQVTIKFSKNLFGNPHDSQNNSQNKKLDELASKLLESTLEHDLFSRGGLSVNYDTLILIDTDPTSTAQQIEWLVREIENLWGISLSRK